MPGRYITTTLVCAALLCLFTLVGCSNDDESGPSTGTVTIHMTDAPAIEGVDAVNLNVIGVSIKQSSDESDQGWETLRSDSMNVNLLTLQNGVFTTLATGRVAAGTYEQVRLKLGAGSTIVVDGVTHPLTVPSGMQSGLKIVGPFTVPSGSGVDLALDFDASRSIILTGSGTYMLKPVVHVMTFAQMGQIKGRVLPTDVTTSVFATMANDTLGSAVTGTDGRFQISVLSAGTYQVRFDPPAAYFDTTLVNVGVTAGHTTDVGDVQLTTNPTP
jgi:hypothetical protein